MDGRNPTEFDFDLKSDMPGADSIRITSDSMIWANNGWNTSAGVVVVVGVKLESVGSYSLILNSQEQVKAIKF